MRFKCWLFCWLMAACLAEGTFAQSGDSVQSAGLLGVTWSFHDDLYIIVLTNPANASRPVVGWTLQPFNLPPPVEIKCPEGWGWQDKGAWKQFRIVRESQKYVCGGPAIEPGEALTFFYRIGSEVEPVNPGGPVQERPFFLSHVGAIGEMLSGKWTPVETEVGSTWFEAPSVLQSQQYEYVPELISSGTLSAALFVLGCLKLRRKWVYGN